MTDVVTTAPSPQRLLRVGDLKQGAFEKAKETFSNHKDAIDILNFIDFLAQNNSVSADDVELPYADGEKHEWKLTRAEVTQLFFGHLEAKKEDIAKSVVLPDDKAEKAIVKAVLDRMESAKGQLRASTESAIATAQQHFNHGYTCLANARKHQDQLDQPQDTSSVLAGLQDALKISNWNFHSFNGTRIKFVSRADVILRHIDQKAGMHYELNCGKFELSFAISDMVPRLIAYERCIPPSTSRHIHPHVSWDGKICFGNAQDAANRAIMSGDIPKLLRLIDALLPNYGDNPYIRISEFSANIEARDKLERDNYGKKSKTGKAASPQDSADEDTEFLEEDTEFEEDWEPEE